MKEVRLRSQHFGDFKVNSKSIFGSSFHEFFPPSFLSILEKTFWWARGENTEVSLFIFLPPHPTKHNLKKFLFLFSLQSFSSTLCHLQTNTPLGSVFRLIVMQFFANGLIGLVDLKYLKFFLFFYNKKIYSTCSHINSVQKIATKSVQIS